MNRGASVRVAVLAMLGLTFCACDGRGARSAVDEREGGEPDTSKVDLDALQQQASAALEAKDMPRAERLAKEVVAASPEGYPYAHVILGDVALDRHAFADALTQYQRASKLDPNDAWAVVRSSQALSELRRKDEARDLLRAFVGGKKVADADTEDALGWLELDGGDTARAEIAFRAAVTASRDKDADAHYGLALAAASRKDVVAVRRELAAVLALDPSKRESLAKDESFVELKKDRAIRALLAAPAK